MKKLSVENIKSLLTELNKNKDQGVAIESSITDLRTKIKDYFEKKAILGFDIYRYSQFPLLEQSLVPHIFKTLYDDTIIDCLEYETFIFQSKIEKDFTNYFIDTGDGGFQIFDTPFHATIFAIYFQANIKRYNSGKTVKLSGLKDIVGELTIRYAITYDATHTYLNNFFGPSIINNARIMSKDKLNRMLIDENTFLWFTEMINGVENLQSLKIKDLSKISVFKEYKKPTTNLSSLIFSEKECKILSTYILKIGEIKSKMDTLSIHSLHIQTLMFSTNNIGLDKYTISLGNLNSSGISE